MITRLYIHRQHIAKNAKEQTLLPVLSIKRRGRVEKTDEAVIHCPECDHPAATLVYRPEGSTCCSGARVWIETLGRVVGRRLTRPIEP